MNPKYTQEDIDTINDIVKDFVCPMTMSREASGPSPCMGFRCMALVIHKLNSGISVRCGMVANGELAR